MKTKVLVLILSILAVMLCITACGGREEELSVKAIEIVKGSYPTECELDVTPNFSGIKVKVTMSDDTTKEVGYADVQISAVDTSTAGKKTVTVTYEGKTATFEITVKEAEAPVATLTGIKIVPGSVSTSVLLAKPFDVSELQVEGIYSDNTKKMLPMEGVTVSDVDTSTEGDKTLTVTYGEFTDSITVKVLGIKEMTLNIDSVAKKINVGQTLDTTGVEVRVTYADDSSVIVSAEDLTIGTIDTSSHGKKKLTITYCGASIEYEIEVVGPTGVSNVGGIANKVKVQGSFDVSNITAILEFSDGTSKPLTAADLTVTNISTATVGKQNLKVAYKAQEDLYTTVEITVVGVDSITNIRDLDSEILKGNDFVKTNVKVTVTYTDGTSDEKVYADLTFQNDIDKNTAGNQTLKITYLDKTVDFPVKVCEVTSLLVEGVNTVVPAGEKPNISNMVVYGVYNDTAKSHTLQLPASAITTNVDDFDLDYEGEDKYLVINYNGAYGSLTARLKISATAPEFIGIRVENHTPAVPYKGTYSMGNYRVYALYGNDTDSLVTGDNLQNVTVEGTIDTNSATVQHLTVKYTEGGVTHTAIVDVHVLPVTGFIINGIPEMVDKKSNGTLNTDNLSLYVTFSDGTYTMNETVAKNNGMTISGTDISTGGEKTLTVVYLDTTETKTYKVREATGISFAGGLNDILYEGESVNASGVSIRVTYNYGADEIFTLAQLTDKVTYSGQSGMIPESALNTSTIENYPFTVTYEGFTITRSFLPIYDMNGLNGTVPKEVYVGDTKAFDYTKFKLTVRYWDGSQFVEKLISYGDPRLNVTQIDINYTEKEQAVIFRYLYTEPQYANNPAYLLAYGKYSTNVTVLVKGVSEIEVVDGIPSTLKIGQSLNITNVQIKVSYTDGSYKYLNFKPGDADFSIGSIDTNTAGTKELTVTYKGKTHKVNVKVVDTSSVSGEIFGAMLPDQFVARTSYMKNFKVQNKTYVVGDDNPFCFYLDVVMLDASDNIVDADGKQQASTVEVYLNGQLLEGADRTQYVSQATKEGYHTSNVYQFTSAAVGKTFTLKIRPASYAGDNVEGVTKSLEVTVVDGYNVYEAWELNLMTNYDDKIDDDRHTLTQSGLVDQYLSEKHNGATRPATLSALVLHNNLNVTLDDLPSEYTVECKQGGGREFYDKFGLYSRWMNPGETFSIYGNYYSIYSYNLPCIAHAGDGIDKEALGSNFSFFRVRGDDEANSSALRAQALSNSSYIPFKDTTFNVNDLGMRDNDPNSNDQSASERHIRGSNAFFVGRNTTNLTNVNVDAYMVSVNVEGGNSWLNLNGTKLYNAWQGHLFLWSSNYYQQSAGGKTESSWSEVRPLTVDIQNSFLAKCGGPVILAMNDNRNMETHPCNANMGVDVNVDNASTLYSYVTGQEAWFVAVGQTQLASQIIAMNQLVSGTATAYGQSASYTSKNFIEGVSTVNMVMVNMGTDPTKIMSGTEQYSGSYTEGGVRGMYMSATYNTLKEQNALYNAYRQATKGKAPIFQTSAGGTVYTDGSSGCYTINFETGQDKQLCPAEFFQGKYITVFYNGVGIMLEYYNTTNPDTK